MRRRTLLTAPLAAALVGGCSPQRDPVLRLMVPNAPGSGYDITARTVATALDVDGVRRDVEVFNLPGAGGMIGLRRLVYEHGNGALMMLMGLGLVGAQHTAPISVTLDAVTPIARLIEEPEVVVVTRDAPLRTFDDLVTAWRADPAGLAVGGGSSPGGPDHLATMLIARAAGIAPSSVRYTEHDGGGVLLAAVLSRRVAFGVSSLGELGGQIDSGQLRVLATTGGGRAAGVEAPTLREAGLDVVFMNWRGLVAPPGLGPAQLAALTTVVSGVRGSATWQRAVAGHRWTDAPLTGAEFGAFLRRQNDRMIRILGELGLPA
ncbi:tripartite tricarboxylate transporter substrate binding protein [Actinoplanes utahensis]|uniref:C4-dicarboxylate ABC transporter substrate-binding protein n=1 Tax=Actinoplanes utahensis TaxID=1869 RepID=A0A0A6UBY5_ACTUT|nr:tripartite tricarboxylate transporter substrate binding protein [Actinoplanes utahensis]KHD73570.1 C4-dicarboxylate ABC transporter substrate-binding protein [Actinoplanes utahensis]GIF33921.1 C4-dicarboxylate ABC transporter substrate-binding protein [Actinoplanes utahensis]